MKKSLLALAVLGAFAGAASAQSSVTIYGIVDVGIAKQNDGNTYMGNTGVGTQSATNSRANVAGSGNRWVEQQGYASRLGFRGIEDLGGGMRAAFNIEHRFTPDNGTGIGQMWFGRSTVSLQGPFGEVLLGRDYIPAFWVSIASDPFGYNGIGAMNSYFSLAQYAAADGGIRNNNSVIYKTPVIAGGLTAQAAVSLGEAARGQLGRSMGANVEYRGGPIYAGFAWDQTKNNGAGDDPQLLMAGASYDFGFIKPFVGYARNRTALAGTIKNMNIGFNAPVGPVGVVHFNAIRLDPNGGNNNTTKFALGYEHYLSKRTSLYADVATAKNQALSRSTGFDLGVTHRF